MSIDIFDERSGLVLASGWHDLENVAGPYRWARANAVVYFPAFAAAHHRIIFEAEPGPSMKRELGELRVFGRYGQKYLHRPFFERSTFEVDLLSPVPMFHELRFVVESTGSARRNDSRILDFRVLTMAVDEIPGDVLPLGSGCFAGCGWHKLERSGTELFRWAETGAQIAASYANVPSVALEIEGGPGVAYRPFDLDVTTSSGKQIGTYRISGRSLLHVSLDGLDTPSERVVLNVGGGAGIDGDARIMNFRLIGRT